MGTRYDDITVAQYYLYAEISMPSFIARNAHENRACLLGKHTNTQKTPHPCCHHCTSHNSDRRDKVIASKLLALSFI